MAEAARPAVDADDDVARLEPEGAGGIRVAQLDDVLHLEVVVARAERAHLVALTALGGGGHVLRLCTRHRAVFLGSLEVLRMPAAPRERPPRAATQHRVHLVCAEGECPGAAEARGNALRECVSEQPLDRLDLRARQARKERADTAGDVETHPARRHDPTLVGIEGGDAADRKAVAPMGIGHRERCLDDAGERGDIGDLLRHLVVHLPD